MKKRTKITKELEQKVIDYYLQGNSTLQCESYFKIGHTTVRNILQRNNIKIRGLLETSRISDSIRKEIIDYYLEGNSHYKISDKFGISRSTSLNILKEYDIRRRTFEEIHRIYSLQEDYFDNIDTEKKAYFLGLFVADGYNNNKQATLSLQEDDEHVLHILKEELKYDSPIRTINKKKGCSNCKVLKSLGISSKKLCEGLTKWGCIQRKSHHTYFPDIPEELYPHFIRGIFDGDGYIHKERKSFTIIGNQDLILKIQEILYVHADIPKVSMRVAHNCKNNILELRYWKKSTILKIRDYLYQNSTVYLQRKYNRFYDTTT